MRFIVHEYKSVHKVIWLKYRIIILKQTIIFDNGTKD